MNPISHTSLHADLTAILQQTNSIWQELAGQSIFITGGTGFFGTWLLETFAFANQQLNLNLSCHVLTRDPDAFLKKVPHLAQHPAITFIKGDIRDFVCEQRPMQYVIHAAGETHDQQQPTTLLNTIIQGTERVLAFASAAKAKKFLLVSSGAIYERRSDSSEIKKLYAIGKYIAEQRCLAETDLEIKIARCFAFLGPYMPLDRQFAIGNFIKDGLSGKDILIQGDGMAIRSYQYASDLVVWLLYILCHGKAATAYDVGAEDPISILGLAHLIAANFNHHPNVIVMKAYQGDKLHRYVPSVHLAREQLNLSSHVPLQSAIQKTIEWYGNIVNCKGD